MDGDNNNRRNEGGGTDRSCLLFDDLPPYEKGEAHKKWHHTSHSFFSFSTTGTKERKTEEVSLDRELYYAALY